MDLGCGSVSLELIMYFITGASRGIGKFLFNALSERGEVVYGSYNSTKPDTSKNLSKVDVSEIGSVKGWIESKAPSCEGITLINCAGINYSALAHKADLDSWKKVIDVNLIGAFNLVHTILPYMRDKKFGRIINFSSVVAQIPIAGTSAYAASKSALWGMTKSIAAENAKLGITINNINLGYFDIGMIGDVPEKIQKQVKSTILSGEFGPPSDILNTVDYLVATGYINGTSIDISSGLV